MGDRRYKPTANYTTPFPGGDAVDFDPDAFDDLIRSKGVMVEHWRAMRCPVGIVDRDDTLRRPHEHHEGCSNGYIYTKAGCCEILFSGNGVGPDSRDQGVGEASTAQVTLPRNYALEDGSPGAQVHVMPYDRLYYKDCAIQVPNWELIEAHPSGFDRLSFPAETIDMVIDNRGVRYPASAYEVVNGTLHWKGPNQPGQDPESQKGRIYSVWYLYRPFWYVQRLNHEIRVSPVDDPGTGERRVVRLPQGATIQREYVYLNQERDPINAGDARQQHRVPADGSIPSK